ncbi:N-acetyltransferase [Vallitalea longa]|uniref:N-acetyltransferase n=1 Tax=Vallitalea longa TaxID=2936439 RepID=A0A9W6DFT9_9FIRM|nr:GNAT family protein [Vallitalea longa]GKX29822.1 N-acetyltransferase [Vallitalea longa]
MDYNIVNMNREYAAVISKWIYEEPYNIYSGDGSNEYIEELLDGSYYAVLDMNNELIGFYCFGNAAQVPAGNEYDVYSNKDLIDIGLGLRPDLCGKSKGYDFLSRELTYAQKKFDNNDFRLTVAEFNKRAINLYERAGFSKVTAFVREMPDNEMRFIVMEK